MTHKILFPGDDPAATLRKTQKLSVDIAHLLSGKRPSPADLAAAPIIDRWSFAARAEPCLMGVISSHPEIGEGRPGLTTTLYAVDLQSGWARTWSCYYRLGRRADEDRPTQ